VAVICQVLGCLFAFLVIAPHADVHYTSPTTSAWSVR
jgi:hypothetical protein